MRDPRPLLRSLVLSAACTVGAASAQEAIPLPPLEPWHGASERLLENVPAEWRTPAELSDFRTTPNYAQTLEFLRKLDRASSLISMREFGRTANGQPLVLVIATRDPRHDFASLRRSPRARVLAQAGIHSGEIDGKDAGLMLLRDIVTGRRADVLDRATLLFIPVYNADGHERVVPTGRVNQRGPENPGWRTTARNLNLNRDYAKADAPETQALIKLLNDVDPDLYLDLHVTDGIDHQYDITYAFNEEDPWSPSIAAWLAGPYRSTLDKALADEGHLPGPYLSERDGRTPDKGFTTGRSSPRFSTGYGDLRHLPTVLLETHSLKPYKRRVLGTYVFIEQSMRAAGDHVEALRKAIAEDRARRTVDIGIVHAPTEKPAREVDYRGIAYEKYESSISGQTEIRWLGRPETQRLPVYEYRTTVKVRRPKAYLIPPAWGDIAAKLRAHGIQVERLDTPIHDTLLFYRLVDPKVDPTPFEGHAMVKIAGVNVAPREVQWPAGAYRVSTDQPLGDLAIGLLEPQAEDSLLAWGYLLEILQRTEYAENYVLEPIARRMLELNPALAAEWKAALQNPEFARDPKKRLEWFYQRSGLADSEYLYYPVAREP